MKNLKKNGGITLVVLVITIIVLLILVGISIQAITNQGLFARANEAKRESEIANIKEKIALDIYEKQLEPPLGSITEEQLETILGKYGTVNKEDGTIVGITTEKGYEILLKDIYGSETVAESVPDGAIVTPVNDITTWLKTGEISNQYSYTTIEQVIADSTCTQSLMNNENAMKYLARSTEFADAICENQASMTYLGQSTYLDDTVLNSDIWFNKCLESQYYDKVFKDVRMIHAGAYETIAMSFTNRTITTNSDGNVNYPIPNGTYTFTGSVSGQSFTRTITSDTTDVWAMPEGALYWYGNYIIPFETTAYHMDNQNDYEEGYLQNPTINDGSNMLTITQNNSNKNVVGQYFTKDVINFSNYTSIKIQVDYAEIVPRTTEAYQGIGFIIVPEKKNNYSKTTIGWVVNQNGSSVTATINNKLCEYDGIKDITGNLYFGLYIRNQGILKVSKIWLE